MKFPKPGKKKKKKRIKDNDYTEWIKTLRCCITSKPSPDPHHINPPGWSAMGSKCSDRRVIPLAHSLHQECHQIGQHTFASKYNLDYEDLIQDYNRRYDERND